MAVGLAALIALGLLGQAVRDRSAAWAVLMYLPLIPLGLAAAGLDGICRGRALPRARFGLGGLGLAAAGLAAWPLIGSGPIEERAGSAGARAPEVSILQWNVVWGGGRRRDDRRWAEIRREIAARGADLVVLSEAPPDEMLDLLAADLGPGTARVQVENEPAAGYWYKLAVFARGPLRLVRREAIARGAAMVVEADLQEGTVRLMVVDGPSHPFVWRTPTLDDVAVAALRARAAGAPFDVLLGDLNSMGRSLGCDAIAEAGYDLASRSSPGWRATFPSYLPLYDIDHVWVGRDHPGVRSELFTNLASDHRGQVARFRFRD